MGGKAYTVPRKLKFERVKKGKPLCVLGRDVTMDMVSVLSQRDLVGKFEFIKLNRNEILDWIQCKWKPFISNIPRVVMLVNGWIVFQFPMKEDRNAIEECY